jgi:hypothetical protein
MTKSLGQLHAVWQRHRGWLLPALVCLMATAAVLKLPRDFYRLLFNTGYHGAIDLKQIQFYVLNWFSGGTRATYYPPATYGFLWPLVGWCSTPVARWIWAITSILALAGSVILMLRITNAKTRWEGWFVALLLLSLVGTAATIGNGQLIIHLLPALLGGVLLLERGQATWVEDLAAAGLMSWVLMKPTVGAPFFWVFLFAWKRLRPALLIIITYSAVTVLACAFRNESVFELLRRFVISSSVGAAWEPGTRNLLALLADLNLRELDTVASLTVLFALGVWTYLNRRADPWLLVGVAAVVARMWTYHRIYDDVLIVLAELALFRIATSDPSAARRTLAGLLLGLTALAMLCPGTLVEDPARSIWIFRSGHVVWWLVVLGFLMYCAWDARGRNEGTTDHGGKNMEGQIFKI